MSETLIKTMAVCNCIIMIITIVITALFQNIYNKVNQTSNYHGNQVLANQPLPLDRLYPNYFPNNKEFESELIVNRTAPYINIKEKLNNKYIMLKKPKTNHNLQYKIEDLYMERSFRLTIKGLTSKYYNKTSVVRMNKEEKFTGLPSVRENDSEKMYRKDIANSINITYTIDKSTNYYTAVINVSLDQIYVHSLYQDRDYIYINLSKPKSVYDKIIVIDAGHGGNDTGSISKDGKYYEKDINLNIVRNVKELLNKEKIKVYYTRLQDEKVYLNPRVNLANDLEADIFLSIHCNASEQVEPSGIEVIYNENDRSQVINSKKIAKICLDELVEKVSLKNRGLVKNDNIYIINHANVPMALIEIAYMSNKSNLEFLINKSNQKKVAEGIYNAIIKLDKEIEQTEELNY